MTIMKHAMLNLDQSSLHQLAALVGTPWRLVTGEKVPEKPRHLFAWDDVVVSAGDVTLAIHNELTEAAFEEEPDEYPLLSVRDGSKRLIADENGGRVFFQHRGEPIHNVYIVRESITQLMSGEPTWEYVTDYAVIFEFAGGAIVVGKNGHHMEGMQVSFADSVATVDIADRSIEWDWDNELGEEYEVGREILPIEDLLVPN